MRCAGCCTKPRGALSARAVRTLGSLSHGWDPLVCVRETEHVGLSCGLRPVLEAPLPAGLASRLHRDVTHEGILLPSLTAQKAASPRALLPQTKAWQLFPVRGPGPVRLTHRTALGAGGPSTGGLFPWRRHPTFPAGKFWCLCPWWAHKPEVCRICDPLPTLGHRLFKCMLHVCAFLPSSGRFWPPQAEAIQIDTRRPLGDSLALPKEGGMLSPGHS